MPIHALVAVGNELLRLRDPEAQKQAAAEGMADEKQHPFVANGKEVGTGDILTNSYVGGFVAQEIAYHGPVLEVVRFDQRGIRSAADGVVAVTNQKTIGVPVSHVGDSAVAGLWLYGVRFIPS